MESGWFCGYHFPSILGACILFGIGWFLWTHLEGVGIFLGVCAAVALVGYGVVKLGNVIAQTGKYEYDKKS